MRRLERIVGWLTQVLKKISSCQLVGRFHSLQPSLFPQVSVEQKNHKRYSKRLSGTLSGLSTSKGAKDGEGVGLARNILS